MIYKDNTMRLWKGARNCTCNQVDCNEKNHRLCHHCGEKVLFGSHASIEKLNKSEFSWNIDFIVQKSAGGNNKINNLCIVHIKCNKTKNRRDQSGEY